MVKLLLLLTVCVLLIKNIRMWEKNKKLKEELKRRDFGNKY
jgi:hypothetical protein